MSPCRGVRGCLWMDSGEGEGEVHQRSTRRGNSIGYDIVAAY